jgi:phosphatidylglycerol:prolipoprotein diacylglycerol transferase
MLSGLMLMLYAVFRFSIEFFRGDYRGDFGIISVTQMITLGVFLLGAGMMVYRKKRT